MIWIAKLHSNKKKFLYSYIYSLYYYEFAYPNCIEMLFAVRFASQREKPN
jgi:hypothetical protein